MTVLPLPPIDVVTEQLASHPAGVSAPDGDENMRENGLALHTTAANTEAGEGIGIQNAVTARSERLLRLGKFVDRGGYAGWKWTGNEEQGLLLGRPRVETHEG